MSAGKEGGRPTKQTRSCTIAMLLFTDRQLGSFGELYPCEVRGSDDFDLR